MGSMGDFMTPAEVIKYQENQKQEVKKKKEVEHRVTLRLIGTTWKDDKR